MIVATERLKESVALRRIIEYAAQAQEISDAYGRLLSGLRAMGFFDVRWRRMAESLARVPRRINPHADTQVEGEHADAASPETLGVADWSVVTESRTKRRRRPGANKKEKAG